MKGTDQERFDAKVDKTGADCWPWTGAKQSRGYGKFFLKGAGELAHRASYVLHKGWIPRGYYVLHRCDNPLCVNPDHLFLGTQADNIADMIRKGRSNPARGLRNGAYTKPERIARGDRSGARMHPERVPKGEANGSSKLTADKVTAIRVEYAGGRVSQRELGRIYGVSNATIGAIIKRKKWRHVA